MSKTHLTAAVLKHDIELEQCLKLYTGSGNNSRVFFFPYRGRLSMRKVSIMADYLAEFYPRLTTAEREYAIRNTAERCSWTHIDIHSGRYGDPLCTFRGDGWMNMRDKKAVIVFKPVHGD